MVSISLISRTRTVEGVEVGVALVSKRVWEREGFNRWCGCACGEGSALFDEVAPKRRIQPGVPGGTPSQVGAVTDDGVTVGASEGAPGEGATLGETEGAPGEGAALGATEGAPGEGATLGATEGAPGEGATVGALEGAIVGVSVGAKLA